MREAVGINTTRVRAHLGAVSLDAPLGAEEGAASFLDMLEDESIPDASSTLVEAERAATVRAAVDRLEGVKRDVVAVHDLEGLTYERVGAMHGMTAERARQIRVAALRDLRRDRQLRRLLDDETLYYQRRGVNTFNSTWTSSTEAAAMWRIQQREKFIKSGTGNRNQLGRGGADRPYRHGEPGDHSQAGQADGGIPLRAR